MQLNSKQYNIILASQSPRRKDLLNQLGYEFRQVSKVVDESYPEDLPVEKVAEYLSIKKAEAYQEELSLTDLLITSDTTVCLSNNILGKPSDAKEAKQMLSELSGSTHTVVTGVCLSATHKKVSFSVSTVVTMKAISEEEIQYYINKYQPFDKAGAYGIQEWIGFIAVEKIEGSFYNVMGLPLKELYEAIEAF